MNDQHTKSIPLLARPPIALLVIGIWLGFTATLMWYLNPISVVDLAKICTQP